MEPDASSLPPTLADLLTHYQADYLYGSSPLTQYQYRYFAQRTLRQLGDTPLTSVTPDVLRRWKQSLARTCKPSTVHRYMRMLSTALRVAVEDLGWLPEHPMARVRKPSPGSGVVRYLDAAEREALLAACRASWHPSLYAIVLLALSTGGRKNEIRCLCWSAVDLEVQVVRFVRTKSKKPRTVPLVGESVEVLRALWARHRAVVPWVFPAPSGRKPVYLETAWRAARLASGVQHFRFHDLRHTYASYLAMAGASILDIAELLGHSKLDMTKMYVHLMPSHTRGVVEAMVGKFLV